MYCSDRMRGDRDTSRPRSRWGAKRAAAGVARQVATDEAAQSHRRSQLRFGLTFLGVAALLFSIYSFPYQENGRSSRWFHRYLSTYAGLAGSVISVFDRDLKVTENVISGRMTLEIVKSCDAMEANLLFVAAIAAWPARWRRKLIAGVLGLAILVVVNVIRICTLYFLGIFAPASFEVVHIEICPLLIVAVAIGEFIGWATWMQRPSPPVLAR